MSLAEMDRRNPERFANALGYFSIGLGLSEVAATDSLANMIGLADTRLRLLKALGLREIANGLAILAAPLRPQWMWSRVAGDTIDLSLLASALASPRSSRGRLMAATAAVAGVTLLDVFCARLLSLNGYQHVNRRWLSGGRGLRLQRSIAINSAPDRLYRFCREFSNLPQIIGYADSVSEIGNQRLRWRAEGPAGQAMEWDTRIIEDRPNELISWCSANSAPIEHGGSIRFLPRQDSHGTIVRVEVLHRPLKGTMSSFLRMLGSRPEFYVAEGLRRFKALIETGEIPTTRGQSSGRPEHSVSVDREVGKPLGLRALLAR
jgi:uncharacterized membrane protein